MIGWGVGEVFGKEGQFSNAAGDERRIDSNSLCTPNIGADLVSDHDGILGACAPNGLLKECGHGFSQDAKGNVL
ncbi:MAG: hypothetical protein RL333_1760, partial [Pseudomonadota bacterium]